MTKRVCAALATVERRRAPLPCHPNAPPIMATRRVLDESAFVLHRHDWSESSLILEVFSRHHGRIALLAKGAKRPHSSYRAVLLPLQRLHLGWGGEAEIKTLKAAEWHAAHAMPVGAALLTGYYLNELILALLAREDPHPRLFDAYAATVALLAQAPAALTEAALRTFELLLLRELGLLPQLDHETATLEPLQAQQGYALKPELGLCAVAPDTAHALAGAHWAGLQAALQSDQAFEATLQVCTHLPAGLKAQLRALLLYHSGRPQLRTRQLWSELLSL